MARVALWGFFFVRALNEAAALFWRKDDSGVILQERDRRIVHVVRIAVDHCFSAAKLVCKCHTVSDDSRLSEQWGERMSGNAMHGARSLMTRDTAERLVASAIWI